MPAIGQIERVIVSSISVVRADAWHGLERLVPDGSVQVSVRLGLAIIAGACRTVKF